LTGVYGFTVEQTSLTLIPSMSISFNLLATIS
jgi:hypothetical protein